MEDEWIVNLSLADRLPDISILDQVATKFNRRTKNAGCPCVRTADTKEVWHGKTANHPGWHRICHWTEKFPQSLENLYLQLDGIRAGQGPVSSAQFVRRL
jgi:hypothetical protein